jgi:drug/metabolite transporter (DMT)-like permease
VQVARRADPIGGPLTPLVGACLAATWICWGATYLAIRYALAGFPPFLLMALRFFIAGALLLGYARARGAPLPSRRQWRNAAIVGALMLGAGMGGTAYAEQTIASGLVVAFIAVTPLLLTLINACAGRYPSRGELAGVLVGLAGVVLLTQGAGFQASPAGLAAMVCGCIGWALGSAFSQRGLPLAPGAAGYASQMLCGGAVLALAAALSGERPVPIAGPGPYLALGYLVVFGSLIAFNAYMYLLGRASAGLASSYAYVNPVIALGLGVTLGGERVTGYEWTSAAVVLSGVVLLLRARR